MNEKADIYIEKNPEWKEVLEILRRVILSTGLEETIKWGVPVYTFNGKNIVGIAAFKHYAGLWFYQGALLKDEMKKLTSGQEGVTKALRQWKFSSLEDVDANLVKAYVEEAIENQKAGKQIKPEKNKPFHPAPELLKLLQENPELKERFNGLTLSRQREYSQHIEEAKREATKANRLEKIIPLILSGKGLYDKYK